MGTLRKVMFSTQENNNLTTSGENARAQEMVPANGERVGAWQDTIARPSLQPIRMSSRGEGGLSEQQGLEVTL